VLRFVTPVVRVLLCEIVLHGDDGTAAGKAR
jgi:hypothetical protein